MLWWQIKTKQDFFNFFEQKDIDIHFLTDLLNECYYASINHSFDKEGYIYDMLKRVNNTEDRLMDKEIIDTVIYAFMSRFPFRISYIKDIINTIKENENTTNISIMTAKEAYKKTNKVHTKLFDSIINDSLAIIKESIEKAVDNGLFAISIPVDLSKAFTVIEKDNIDINTILIELRNILTKLGYVVSFQDDDVFSYDLIIGWDNHK